MEEADLVLEFYLRVSTTSLEFHHSFFRIAEQCGIPEDVVRAKVLTWFNSTIEGILINLAVTIDDSLGV